MALFTLDSMDAVSNDEIITRYDIVIDYESGACGTTPDAGRFGTGTQAYNLNNTGIGQPRLGNSGVAVSKMIAGIWTHIGVGIGTSGTVLAFRSADPNVLTSGIDQVAVVLTSAHQLELWCGGVLRTSSVSALPNAANVFNGIELEAHFHSTTGSATVYVSGAFFFSFIGSTTTATGSSFNQALYGRSNGLTVNFDDWYVFTDQGDTNTQRLGSAARIRLHRVNASAVSAWTPIGAAANDLCVDETLPDDVTTYVHTSAAGTTDRYNVTAATGVYSSAETPRAVQVVARAQAPSGGSPTLTLLCELSGVVVSAPTLPCSTAWMTQHLFPVSLRPGGSTWAVSHIDNVTIGVENGIAAPSRVTWAALEVITAGGASAVASTTLTASLVWIQSSVSGVRNVIVARGTTVSADWIVSGGISTFTYGFTFAGTSNIAGFASTAATSIATRTYSVAGVREVSATVSDASGASITSAVRVHTAAAVVPNYHDGKVTLSSQKYTRTVPL